MHWAVICARGEEEETLRKEKRGALGRGGRAENDCLAGCSEDKIS